MPELTIQFTPEDLVRLRPGQPDPMWEIVLSLQVLQQVDGLDGRLRRWRRDALRHLSRTLDRTDLRDLFSVAPAVGYFPDFLTPGCSGEVENHLDRIRLTSTHRVRDEIARIESPPLPGSTLRQVLLSDPSAGLVRLTRLLRRYTRAGRRTKASRGADLAAYQKQRAEHQARGGMEAILAGFDPRIARWEEITLRLPYCEERTMDLDGRGVTLVPSWFCFRHAVTLADPDLPPVLVHPITPVSGDSQPLTSDAEQAVAALIGGTRAKILAHCDGRSTGDIAETLEVAPSTVSEHVGVLRDSGLVVTRKAKTRTQHERTTTGDRLIGL